MRHSSLHAASPREDSHLYTNLNARVSDFRHALIKHKSEVPVRYSSRDPMDEFAMIPHSYRSSISRRGMASLGNMTDSSLGSRSAKLDSVVNETLRDVGFAAGGSVSRKRGQNVAGRKLSRSVSASVASSSAMERARRHAPEGEAPVSFGHRPGSASRVLNPLSLSISKIPKRKRNLPAAGVLSAMDLFQLLHNEGSRADHSEADVLPSDMKSATMTDSVAASFAMSPGYKTIGGMTSSTDVVGGKKEVLKGQGWLGGYFLVGGAESMFVEDAPAGDENVHLSLKRARRHKGARSKRGQQ